ncbi:heavy metal-responsive transcriptional regulator [Cellulomonas sp. APG4]|uniref:MerR family transcriptional regulator n=1 Tax=Cellulomonas carbonis T26 TaxID=947969 RepID=A0A0A0BXY9_9CELL|nr:MULTISPECIES: heavy metal-responsive transcriptional regulator [Cellulomonadaceae]KGM12766.1 MerR family transcriptional regulator [Cellulomonas carbonis T26]MDT0166633.1 heavy metal-responsive transcriptional regulator [Actinotalea sp. AC32]NCT89505.1 heavy metal-responsive transcriptional regulator [Cellulomonas sp. APG4]GGC14283.1 heavy metal-responsive transcriptional regulator [Cellulomonas carbonis]
MRIGELAQASGTTTKTLRYYEQAGLLPAPERTITGYRDYEPATLQRLNFIRRGQAAGLTLAQIREVLHVRDAGGAPCHHVRELLDSRVHQLDRQIAHLQALRETVTELRDAAAEPDPGACDPTAVCRYL